MSDVYLFLFVCVSGNRAVWVLCAEEHAEAMVTFFGRLHLRYLRLKTMKEADTIIR